MLFVKITNDFHAILMSTHEAWGNGEKMKKNLILCTAFMLSILSLHSVKAMEVVQYDAKEDVTTLNELIDYEGIDIEYELTDSINLYKVLLNDAKDEETKTKLYDLIDGTTLLLDEYTANKKLRANPANAAVVSVIAYFNNKGYSLSKELLVHATQNSNKYSTYKPVNGSVVKLLSIFRNIALGSSTSGSSSFPNQGSTAERDCYYAIHAFRYTKSSSSSRSVTVKDYYDFAKGDYSGPAGIAVDAMYNAQINGSIVPFHVEILSSYNPNYQSLSKVQ